MGHDDVRVVGSCGVDGTEGYLFQQPESILVANRPGEVLPVLREVQRAVDNGKYAAGFLAYEAGSGLDNAMRTHSADALPVPLAWFGIFRRAEEIRIPDDDDGAGFNTGTWHPSMSAGQHAAAVGRIKEYLRSGDSYQVNYTFRLRTSFTGEPWSLFCRIQRNQRARYAAFIETDRFAVCSASPELFFSLDGDTLLSKPMKGTSSRGLTAGQDRELANRLQSSAKERAENVMIVDMVRNDMGRIAERETVTASHMFEVEQYPTVLQMISTVTCKTSANLPEIMKALFPCASITGAPKIRTMQIIRELEPEPRGIYTGCVGYVLPGRQARFNVAIRTVLIDKRTGTAEYGVGGGIVWDSDAGKEYQECMVKSEVLTAQKPRFDLLETMLWEGNKGYFLLEEHLERIAGSTTYFGFAIDTCEIRKRLDEQGEKTGASICKVRLLVSEKGGISVTSEPLAASSSGRLWRVALAEERIDPDNPYLYHKTTSRLIYDRARKSRPGHDDVLLVNTRGQVTESTIANVVIEKNGRLLTPPASCGLLAGVFRNWLIDSGKIVEQALTVDDILNCGKLFLINSVRRWIPAELDRESISGCLPCKKTGAAD